MVAIATPGLVLAVARFDRMLLQWLAVLGALLPPLLVPMAVEAARRRRGHEPRPVRMWTWVPAALIALTLTLRGVGVAALVGFGVSAASMAIALRLRRR
jgi:amino acid transporter